MTKPIDRRAYSANVAIRREVNDIALSVGRIGPNEATLSESCDVPPGTEARVVVTIDGVEQSRVVVLSQGIKAGDRDVLFSEGECQMAKKEAKGG